MSNFQTIPAGQAELRTIACDIGEPVTALPERVLIVPWGQVRSKTGDFIFDAESARLIRQEIAKQGVELAVDYEHQTLGGNYSSPDGKAPAAGWIKRLEVEEGVGLWAFVQWTPPAARALSVREYRYLSPVVLVRKSDGKVVGLHSVALTNTPAIEGFPAIVNSTRTVNRQRADIIRKVTKDWDSSEPCQRMTCRSAFVNGDLRQAGLAVLTNAERKSIDSPDPEKLAAVTNSAGREWDSQSPTLQRLCSREAFIQESLREAGLVQVVV